MELDSEGIPSRPALTNGVASKEYAPVLLSSSNFMIAVGFVVWVSFYDEAFVGLAFGHDRLGVDGRAVFLAVDSAAKVIASLFLCSLL